MSLYLQPLTLQNPSQVMPPQLSLASVCLKTPGYAIHITTSKQPHKNWLGKACQGTRCQQPHGAAADQRFPLDCLKAALKFPVDPHRPRINRYISPENPEPKSPAPCATLNPLQPIKSFEEQGLLEGSWDLVSKVISRL